MSVKELNPKKINPKKILEIIKKKFNIDFPNPILEYDYDEPSETLVIRFFVGKDVESTWADENFKILVNREKGSGRINSIEIMDLESLLADT